MKRRNLFMSATLMCGLFTIAFTFDSNHIHWIWRGQELGAIVLGVAAIIFSLYWYKSAKKLGEVKQDQLH
jgi:formate hydrogenlyase subunit 4